MLHFSQTKPGDGPAIVFLHAAGFDRRMWIAATERLPEFNCICIDLPGHGKSKAVEVTDFAQAGDAVADVIGSLGGAPVDIAGLSMGSYIGFKLMARHPGLVRTAVLSGFQCDPIPSSAFLRTMMHVSSWMMASKRSREKMARSMGIMDVRLISQPDRRANASAATMRKIGADALAFDVRADLPDVPVRTLVIAGEKEHSAINASLPVFQDRMPNCTARLVPGLGHGWIARDPDLFAATMKAWIRQETLPERLAGV
ncbi:alpha/beta hydrolase [Labrenzia sp. 011]|uniref:alpha/beta fold hydrolase n=1 Tax=Labrenzia sp. 011 TaxID=2171494 RepID=UPI000D51B84B|nr:alpha/beta hydrolase [Labrenzia sp. 011]PVB61993.1 hypothetical protein DCO57_08865 [Labrenzia sp. 011]